MNPITKMQKLIYHINKTGSHIHSEMVRYVKVNLKNEPGILEKSLYALKDNGLRIRPFLVKLGAEFGNKSLKDILQVATATEFMQISTLVIDDILDRSDKRNNVPSLQAKWGIREAILVGEILKSFSTQIISNQNNLTLSQKITILSLLEKTYSILCMGQYNDVLTERELVNTEKSYFSLIEQTTAKFIETSLIIGAISSNINEKLLKCLQRYGKNLGIAYQIRDDIIDVIGDTKLVGKPIGEDISSKKMRLPVIYAITNCGRSVRSQILSRWRKTILEKKDVTDLIQILLECGAIDQTIKKAKLYCSKASDSLIPLNNSLQKQVLIDLSELVCTF